MKQEDFDNIPHIMTGGNTTPNLNKIYEDLEEHPAPNGWYFDELGQIRTQIDGYCHCPITYLEEAHTQHRHFQVNAGPLAKNRYGLTQNEVAILLAAADNICEETFYTFKEVNDKVASEIAREKLIKILDPITWNNYKSLYLKEFDNPYPTRQISPQWVTNSNY